MNEFSEAIVSAPVVILTGAGASVPLEKATTETFMERVPGLPLSDQLLQVFETVRKACTPSEGVQTVDIEVVLDHLTSRIESADMLRDDPNFGPLLFAANPPRDALNVVLKRYRDLREALLDEVVRHYGEVNEAAAARLYRRILVDLPKTLKVPALPVFTLNYDLAVEAARDGLRVRLVDGLDRRRTVNRTWSAEQFHKFRASRATAVVLFKLHGSVSWCRDDHGAIREVVGLHRDPPPFKHVVMYPSLRSKNLQGEPWSTGYGYLRECLGRARVAVIIGTSLRDAQLVDALRSALAENEVLTLVFVDPSRGHEGWSQRLDVKASRVAAIAAPFGGSFVRAVLGGVVSAMAAARTSTAGGRTWRPPARRQRGGSG
jgi:hypothetical protein